MAFRTLSAVRAEARRRGMAVVQQRRTYAGRGPLYHVYAFYWDGVNLQQQAGDLTPSRHGLDGLPELFAWADLQWSGADNPQTVPPSGDSLQA